MSYILEALRKMERQRRREAGTETWMDALTAGPEEEEAETRGPGRWLLAASVFFGLAGIVTGFLLYHGSQPPEREPLLAPQVQSLSATAPAGKSAVPPEKTAVRAKPEEKVQAVTLSELKSTATPSPSPDLPTLDRVLDLTARHRLSSTGEIGGRKYATLDREDYFVGDHFRGMVITDIQKDRVQLKGKRDDQHYVIIFRYR